MQPTSLSRSSDVTSSWNELDLYKQKATLFSQECPYTLAVMICYAWMKFTAFFLLGDKQVKELSF